MRNLTNPDFRSCVMNQSAPLAKGEAMNRPSKIRDPPSNRLPLLKNPAVTVADNDLRLGGGVSSSGKCQGLKAGSRVKGCKGPHTRQKLYVGSSGRKP